MKTFHKHVLVCTNSKPGRCSEKGGEDVLEEFRKQVIDRNLSAEMYITKTGCTGQHAWGPAVIIYPEGVWYEKVSPADVAEIIESHLVNGKIVERLHNKKIWLK
jgi:(2Fe-2S) ferredoxin